MKREALCGLVAVLLAVSAVAVPGAQQGRAPASPSNAWERSRQCSEQASQIVARPEVSRASTDVIRFNSWSNHYNAERERCYVALSYFGNGKDPDYPLFTWELIDAFENRAVSRCTWDDAKLAWMSCDVKDKWSPRSTPGDCNACRAYFLDRMTKSHHQQVSQDARARRIPDPTARALPETRHRSGHRLRRILEGARGRPLRRINDSAPQSTSPREISVSDVLNRLSSIRGDNFSRWRCSWPDGC